jgi:hypothetical protein
MRPLRRLFTLAAVATLLATGLASPAQANESPPQIGSVCHPERATKGVRTVDFWFENRSDLSFELMQSYLNHGVWSGTAPPVSIAPGEWICWRAESSGVATGTQGGANYRIARTDGATPAVQLRLSFNNPYLGGNSFGCAPPRNHRCDGVKDSGGGNHPTPIFQMRPR